MQITIREPGSAITHFVGMMLAIIAGSPLIIKAGLSQNRDSIISMGVFIASMVGLYGASTLYHSINTEGRVLRIFRKIDHMMIFVLIAGSYTPVCLLVLGGRSGRILLLIVWTAAFLGMVGKAIWVSCPKWFSSIVYISMGWMCLLRFSEIRSGLSATAFFWLVMGGVLYTAGGIIYAVKIPVLSRNNPYFGNHEIFHLFVMGGSACHFVLMFNYLL